MARRMASAPPVIFSKLRKRAREARAEAMSAKGDTATFLLENMADDIHERLGFLRFEPADVLCEGFGAALVAEGPWLHDVTFHSTLDRDFDTPLDLFQSSLDMVCSLNSLDTVNDLPGALIQMRELLKPGGLAMASFIGGASLPQLRRAMFEAEPDRPAARIHPMIDPRSCPQLLSRAGWNSPVVDSYQLKVRYSSLDRLVQDLREQAMSNLLEAPAAPLTRSQIERAREAFLANADADGKVTEIFEIVTLTGWR